MNKTRLLTKKFMLACVLALVMVASTVMGIALVNPVKATSADDMYFGNFSVTGGTLSYDTVKIQAKDNNDNTTGHLSATVESSGLVVNLNSSSSVFSFAKPIDFTQGAAIAIAPIWDDVTEMYNISDYDLEFFITLTDAANANNTVTIRQRFQPTDCEYYALANHSGLGNKYVGYNKAYLSVTNTATQRYGTRTKIGSYTFLKSYTLAEDGKVNVGYLELNGGEWTTPEGLADVMVADLRDSNYVGTNAWSGFEGDEVYVSVTAAKASSFVITSIGNYDLIDVESDAYKAEEAIEVESYDYFNLVDGTVEYKKAKIQTVNPNFNTETLEGF